MRRAILCLVLAGCGAHSSHIGPYVTNVERRGAELAVVVCDVMLDNGTLSMGRCFEQRVPIAGLPQPPAP